MTAQTKFRSLKLAPFDIYLRTLAFKVRNAVGSFLSDEEVIENIDVMANFMRGVYQGGVSISLRLKELIQINKYITKCSGTDSYPCGTPTTYLL